MTMIQEIINFESRVRNPSQRALDRFFQQPSTRSSFTCHREIRKCIKEGRRIMRQTLEPRDGEVEERVGRFNEGIDPTSIQNRWIRFSVKIELCPWPISWWFSFYYEGGRCVRQGIYSKNMPRIHNTHARANYKYSSLQLPSWPSFRKDHLCLIGKVWWKAMKNV